MPIDVKRGLDFGGVSRITSLPTSTANGQPVVHEQLKAAVEGMSWKDNVRVSTQANITIASPGATIDGITMVANDRVLVRAQTTATENGIYIWNGAATPMTRALDSDTFDKLESAITTVDEGTNAGVSFRQTQVNGVIGTNNVAFATFGTGAAAATETTAGIAEIATQAETDAGVDDSRIVTPLKLATSPFAKKKFSQNIGDGTATSIAVTHNLNTRDVAIEVYRNSGNFDDVLVETQRTSVNVVTVLFDAAPAANAFRVVIVA